MRSGAASDPAERLNCFTHELHEFMELTIHDMQHCFTA